MWLSKSQPLLDTLSQEPVIHTTERVCELSRTFLVVLVGESSLNHSALLPQNHVLVSNMGMRHCADIYGTRKEYAHHSEGMSLW
jgi:hypothetical protein